MIDNLNERQLEAVENLDGPMLVLAGAGSGKTRVLTTKVAYLLDQKDISPKNILAITFTNKAAKEMKERIFNLVGREAFLIQISTFHSLGLKLIKENSKKKTKISVKVLSFRHEVVIIVKIIIIGRHTHYAQYDWLRQRHCRSRRQKNYN